MNKHVFFLFLFIFMHGQKGCFDPSYFFWQISCFHFILHHFNMVCTKANIQTLTAIFLSNSVNEVSGERITVDLFQVWTNLLRNVNFWTEPEMSYKFGHILEVFHSTEWTGHNVEKRTKLPLPPFFFGNSQTTSVYIKIIFSLCFFKLFLWNIY